MNKNIVIGILLAVILFMRYLGCRGTVRSTEIVSEYDTIY